MNIKKYFTSEKRIFFGLSLMLWIYLWVRAYIVPMAHDEIATFYYYVTTSNFIPYFSHWDANNHVLNSLLSWISYELFGSSPLALRIPNLLTFPIFIWYTYKIAGELSTKVFRWVFLLSLCFAHYFIEFFALSRGYGMSMAFMTGAIWYLMLLYKEKDSLKNYTLCLLFIILAIGANLTLINTFAIITGLLFFNILIKQNSVFNKEALKRVGLIIALGIIPLLLAAKFVIDMKAHGNLYAGSGLGFIRLTIWTLIDLITGYDYLQFAYSFVFLVAVICLYFLVLYIRNHNIKFIANHKHLFLYLLIGNIITTLILGKVFKINYPEDRLGLYFFPLFIGSLIFITEEIYLHFNKKIFLIILLPLLFLPFHFITHINFTYTNCYKTDVIPQRFYDKVYKDYKQGQFPPTNGGEGLRHFCWAFLDYRNGGKLCPIYSESYPGYETDYLIADIKDNPKWLLYYDSIDYCKVNSRYLLKRKHPVTKTYLNNFYIKSQDNITNEFYNLIDGKTDTLTGKTLYFTFKLTLKSETQPFEARIVISVTDKQGKEIRYEFIGLDWLRKSWNGEKDNFMNTMFVYKLPEDASKFLIYIWNINKVPYNIKEGEIKVYSINTK